AAQQDAYLAELSENDRALVLGINGQQAYARFTAGSKAATAQPSAALSTGEWHHLTARIGDGHLTLFIDGLDAAHVDSDAQDVGGTLTLGGAAANAHFFSGEMDELQIANVVRSADWIKAAARSQGMTAALVVYGGDTQREGGGQSYFATTLRNVTIDGW